MEFNFFLVQNENNDIELATMEINSTNGNVRLPSNVVAPVRLLSIKMNEAHDNPAMQLSD